MTPHRPSDAASPEAPPPGTAATTPAETAPSAGTRSGTAARARPPDLTAVFRAGGVTGSLHATDIDTGAQVSVGADDPVVLASVFKLPLLVEFYRQAEAGVLDPALPCRVEPGDRTSGGTGLAAMLDPATLSLRDLAYLMIAVSDNAAADVLARHVGLAAVNAMLGRFGLTATRVEHDCRGMLAALEADAGRLEGPLHPRDVPRLRVLDPAHGNRSTPREMARLLGMVWRDEAAGPEACAAIRRLLGLQVWPHRLASGFPYDDVVVSGKTGSLPTLRNEVGVVEYPDGGRYAVAVFTRSIGTAQHQPRADAAIGLAARAAVDHLRTL
ncbi:serine hydrolase [Sphaerisporangium melleum]|uniref:Serine hydrolase n=1 Tax=Sphaerisporangium melleum TaxID=321316 RepID=A0A917QX98_9ACTN|nr:serine hydrolase [Sphaerisporangium melleum]GGK75465.1 serine hydrolase [Sphaerisporangium melleum]GII72637.1 serine hydrolase [Sphaerisporangium melleum]